MQELAGHASLIVTVDCGTNSAAAIEAAKSAGADVGGTSTITRLAANRQAAAHAVVNPNREDDLSGQGHLCAAGVVFLTLVQTLRTIREQHIATGVLAPDLLSLLDLVALATVCDVVPLKELNRAFVVKGILVARAEQNVGLAALARVSRIGEPLNAFRFAYLVGPRIDAGGRIGDAGLGARLLTLNDPNEAMRIAEELDRLNQERQAMETVMLEQAEAEAMVELSAGTGPAVLVTASDDWHPGIVGLDRGAAERSGLRGCGFRHRL